MSQTTNSLKRKQPDSTDEETEQKTKKQKTSPSPPSKTVVQQLPEAASNSQNLNASNTEEAGISCRVLILLSSFVVFLSLQFSSLILSRHSLGVRRSRCFIQPRPSENQKYHSKRDDCFDR
jgi:hypothetical protein